MHNNYGRRAPKIASLVSTFIVVAIAGTNVSAASFDCTKAKASVEMAVCKNTQLSALDDRLAEVYGQLLKHNQDEVLLRSQQHAWLRSRMLDCEYQDNIDSCLIDKYKRRVGLLMALQALRQPTTSPHGEIGSRYLLGEVSKRYDFVLHLLEKCEPAAGDGGGTCEGPGILGVFRKRAKTPMQLIPMNNIFVSFTNRGKPLTNSAALYDYQGVINVGDFNFDGREDFAVQNGNHGSYSGPSYDIYVSAGKGKGFQFNSGLSSLIDRTLGFFQVDAEKKHLITFGKDGCCYHATTEYKVVDNKPVPISRVIERATDDRSFTHEERWVNGKWTRLAEEFQHKSTGPVMLLPAQKAAESDTNTKPPEVLHFPGKEYKSGSDWWALSCSSHCRLVPARLTVTPKSYPLDDASKVSGQSLKWSTASLDGILLYFRAQAKVFTPVAGPIITANPIHAPDAVVNERAGRQGGSVEPEVMSLLFAMPNGTLANVMPMLVLPNSKASRSEGVPTLELRIKGQRQTLISEDFKPDDFFADRKSYVPWLGDLDGDGKPDLILNESPSSTCGVKMTLFLSSLATTGQLVGKAGEFDSLRIYNKECN